MVKFYNAIKSNNTDEITTSIAEILLLKEFNDKGFCIIKSALTDKYVNLILKKLNIRSHIYFQTFYPETWQKKEELMQ